MTDAAPALRATGLEAFYGDFQALFGIDFELRPGETVAIIGANGAGKTTFLKTLCGLLSAPQDAVSLYGLPVGGRPAHEVVRLGLAMTPEGRQLFPSLTVEENLMMGAMAHSGPGHWFGNLRARLTGAATEADVMASETHQGWDLESVYALFPILRERRNNPGTALSGGQQQMVAIGRSLMSNPRVLLCDEISLGLAPTVIKDIYAALPQIKARGASIVVVEQDIQQALAVADRFYCFQEGRVSLTGRPGDVSLDDIAAAYFGA